MTLEARRIGAELREMIAEESGITGGSMAAKINALVRLAEDQAIQWPKGRDVGRLGDMAPAGFSHLRVLFDNDNDVIVEIWDQDPRSTIGQSASIEFCNPGACGGGQSTHTRKALIALMVAIEKDNAEMPHKAWPAPRDAE